MYKLLIAILFVSFTLKTLAQKDKTNNARALQILENIEQQQPKNYNIKFLIGSQHLKAQEYKKAILWLEKCLNYTEELQNSKDITPAPTSTYFLLGKSYFYNYEFNKAQLKFEKYVNFAKTNSDKIEELDIFMQATLNAKKLIKNPIEITKHNLTNINSTGFDIKPLLNSNESIIIFSRKDGIYYCKKENQKWNSPSKIEELSISKKVVAASLSIDGNQLFINVFNGKNWDIYQSNLNGNKWSKPIKLNSNINTKYDDKSASISTDGNTLYFSSNRDDGYGGFDIFYSTKLPNGTWGKAINIGKNINTQFDDYSPFIFHDNNTLYFSSTGHNSMGKKDIFYTTKLDNKYSKPKNIGYPINTVFDDELGYISVDGERIYYSTNSGNNKDIHIINIKSKLDNKLVVIESYITNTANNKIKDIIIEIKDRKTGKSLGVYKPNSNSGKFTLILPIDTKYNIESKSEKYTLKNSSFEIPKNVTYHKIKKSIRLKNIGTTK